MDSSLCFFIQQAFEHAGDAISIHKTDGTLLQVNKAFCKLTGLEKEEIVGRKCYEVVHNEHVFPYFCPIIRVVEDLKHQKIEFSMDGRYFLVSIYPVIEEGNNISAIIHIIKDITDIKKREIETKTAYKFLKDIIDAIAEPIIVVDTNYEIKLMNKAACDSCTASDESLLCYRLFHDLDNQCNCKKQPCPIEEVKKTGKPVKVVHKHTMHDGKVFYFEIIASPLYEDDGTFNAAVESIRDITERKLVEEEKDLFTDIMYHDLLNPIGLAMSYLELLLISEKDDEKRKILTKIQKSLGNAVELMETATKLSKIQFSENIEFEDIDIKKIIDEVLDCFSYLSRNLGVKIENRITHPMFVKANRIIEEVFMNLISNTLKYASEGKRVIIEGEDRSDMYIIKVMDFDVGVEDKYKSIIFDRFTRKKKSGVKGSGLGLTIARKIMELHRGKIWVEDNTEGGATFVVEIPKLQKNKQESSHTSGLSSIA